MRSVTRRAFERTASSCACRLSSPSSRACGTQLARWRRPNRRVASSASARHDARRTGSRTAAGWQRLGDIPVWAQVAAAMLFLGVSAAVANLDISVQRSGLSVRTGWMSASAPAGACALRRAPALHRSAQVVRGTAGADAAPWRADLAALEQQLRSEMRSSPRSAQRARRAAGADRGGTARSRARADRRERAASSSASWRFASRKSTATCGRNASRICGTSSGTSRRSRATRVST